jgi:hypothetical protein
MNTTKTKQPPRPPAARATYSHYYALRIRKASGLEWRVFVCNGYAEAMRKAEHVEGCLEVVEVHPLTREEYLVAVERLKKGAVK